MVTKLVIDPSWMKSEKVVFPIKKIIAHNFDSEYQSMSAALEILSSDEILFLKLLLDQSLEEFTFAIQNNRLEDGYIATFNISVLLCTLILREGISVVTTEEVRKAKARLFLILTLEANKALGRLQNLELMRSNYSLTEENPRVITKPKDE